MIKTLHFIIIFVLGLSFLSCKSESKKIEQFEKITVDENLSKSDSFKIFSKYPELKLFNSEKLKAQQGLLISCRKIDFIQIFILRKKHIGFINSMIINVKRNTKEIPSIFGLTITTDILETVF